MEYQSGPSFLSAIRMLNTSGGASELPECVSKGPGNWVGERAGSSRV